MTLMVARRYPRGTQVVAFARAAIDLPHARSSSFLSSTRGPAMSGNTIRLHRVFAAPPERVYRAFLDPAALAKWLPPNGFTCTVHEMDARVGGGHRMSFTNFS